MNNPKAVAQLQITPAENYPDRITVEETEGGTIRYRDLIRLSDQFRDSLTQ